MYTVSEFRENLRKAMNDADEGHEVLIERYGQTYQLSSLIGKPGKDGTYYKGPIDKPEADEKDLKAIREIKTCKHGSAIGLCKFGCKK